MGGEVHLLTELLNCACTLDFYRLWPTEPTSSTNRLKSYSIVKLMCNGSNWITWKSQMLMTLAASHEVMHHIEGTA